MHFSSSFFILYACYVFSEGRTTKYTNKNTNDKDTWKTEVTRNDKYNFKKKQRTETRERYE